MFKSLESSEIKDKIELSSQEDESTYLTGYVHKVEIHMDDKFELLDCNDDVVSFSKPEQTFKIGKLQQKVKEQFNNQLGSYSSNEGLGFISVDGRPIFSKVFNWMSTSIDCEILRLGAKSWQKGKLRIQVAIERIPDDNRSPSQQQVQVHHVYLEFDPDEPEISEPQSPLDDLRQMINQESQQ